jgi:hypothetical protein
MGGVKQQDSTPQNDSTLGFNHTYITEDYTSCVWT